MTFGISVSFVVPKPRDERSDWHVFHEAAELVTLADEPGFDSIWSVEHHFLEEYSHAPSSCPRGRASPSATSCTATHGAAHLEFACPPRG